MALISFTYSPTPALPNVRLSLCIILETDTKNEQYQIHPQHRDNTPKKAQWRVSYEDELTVFAWAAGEEIIIDEQYMWGLLVIADEPCYIGYTEFGDPSKIAIFDNGGQNGFWHGYPVDYIRSQEYPPESVLAHWRDMNYITKADLRRIIRGKW